MSVTTMERFILRRRLARMRKPALGLRQATDQRPDGRNLLLPEEDGSTEN